MSEHDSGEQRDAALQAIVDRLTDRLAGEDPQTVRADLEQQLRAADLPVRSEKWLGDTAVEIAAGRRLVVDGRQGLRADPDDDIGASAETGSPGRPEDARPD